MDFDHLQRSQYMCVIQDTNKSVDILGNHYSANIDVVYAWHLSY